MYYPAIQKVWKEGEIWGRGRYVLSPRDQAYQFQDRNNKKGLVVGFKDRR